MPDRLQESPDDPGLSDFLATLEEAEILPRAAARDARDAMQDDPSLCDLRALVAWLASESWITEFQAHRLLGGNPLSLCFGRYLLVDRLGVGAMGRVFKARHRLMDRLVAIKVVLPSCVASRNVAARFFREMKIVGRLDHPNVVRAFDADQLDDSPYIVMEYLEGEDMERVLRRRGLLHPQEVVDCMAQAAWGLAHAHEKGVVHRDIKPTNLFLDCAGTLKILDLGLGAFAGGGGQGDHPQDADEGFVVGTCDYLSPEQLAGEPVDARTDLYSLGCTMYRLLTGRFPFPGAARMDRMVKRLSEPPVPISSVRQHLPVPLIAALDRLLARRPEDRYATAAEAAEALETMLPVADRRRRTARTSVATRPALDPTRLPTAEPETPLDWSMVASGLKSRHEPAAEPALPAPSFALETPSSSPARATPRGGRIDTPGRVSQGHGKGTTQSRKLGAEASPSREAKGPTVVERWMERLGEKLGDFLAEPSAGHLILILSVAALIVAVGLAYTLS